MLPYACRIWHTTMEMALIHRIRLRASRSLPPQGDILIPNILTNEMADDALAGVAVAVGVDCVRHGVVIV